jgi:hypothetical protein
MFGHDERLITLTGIGGCGKTRLAFGVASTLVGSFRDGVWLVSLAPLLTRCSSRRRSARCSASENGRIARCSTG